MTDTTQRTKHLAKYPAAGVQGVTAPSNEIRLMRHPVKRAFSVLGTLAATMFVSGFWYFMVRVTPPGLNPIVIITSVIGGLILLTQVAFLHRELSVRSICVVDGCVARVTSTLGIRWSHVYPSTTRFMLARQQSHSDRAEPDIECVLFARDGRRVRRVAASRDSDNLSEVIRFLDSQPGISACDASNRKPLGE